MPDPQQQLMYRGGGGGSRMYDVPLTPQQILMQNYTSAIENANKQAQGPSPERQKQLQQYYQQRGQQMPQGPPGGGGKAGSVATRPGPGPGPGGKGGGDMIMRDTGIDGIQPQNLPEGFNQDRLQGLFDARDRGAKWASGRLDDLGYGGMTRMPAPGPTGTVQPNPFVNMGPGIFDRPSFPGGKQGQQIQPVDPYSFIPGPQSRAFTWNQ